MFALKRSRITLDDLRNADAGVGDIDSFLRRLHQQSALGSEEVADFFSKDPMVSISSRQAVRVYIFYCALFHHDVDATQKYGYMPRDQPHLNATTHSKYFRHCTSHTSPPSFHHFSPMGKSTVEYIAYTCDSARTRNCILRNFMRTRELDLSLRPEPREAIAEKPNEEELFKRGQDDLFIRVISHQGWPSLMMLFVENMLLEKTRLEAIRLSILEMSDWRHRPFSHGPPAVRPWKGFLAESNDLGVANP